MSGRNPFDRIHPVTCPWCGHEVTIPSKRNGRAGHLDMAQHSSTVSAPFLFARARILDLHFTCSECGTVWVDRWTFHGCDIMTEGDRSKIDPRLLDIPEDISLGLYDGIHDLLSPYQDKPLDRHVIGEVKRALVDVLKEALQDVRTDTQGRDNISNRSRDPGEVP